MLGGTCNVLGGTCNVLGADAATCLVGFRRVLGGFAVLSSDGVTCLVGSCRVLGDVVQRAGWLRVQSAGALTWEVLGGASNVLGGVARSLAFRRDRGTGRAYADRMVVSNFQDLLCWQLSYELKCEVFAFTAKRPASLDFKYRDQIRDSAAAAPRDISEGFGRFRPREFARFLEFARASLMETQTSLIDGRDRGYLTRELGSRLLNLAAAALRVTTRLMRSKQRQAGGVDKRTRPPKRSFSISVAELEERRRRRERSGRGKA